MHFSYASSKSVIIYYTSWIVGATLNKLFNHALGTFLARGLALNIAKVSTRDGDLEVASNVHFY